MGRSEYPPTGISGAPREAAEPAERVTVWQLLGMLLRHRRLLLGVAGAVLLVGILIIVLAMRTPTYTTHASFMPEQQTGRSAAFGALAAQLGFAAAPQGGLGSPQFQAGLLTSRRLLGSVAESAFTLQTDTGNVTAPLMDVIAGSQPDPQIRRAVTVGWLSEAVDVRIDGQTGLVELAVTAGTPTLARSIGSRLLELAAELNVAMRQAQATAEREFVESQLAASSARLKAVEDSLQAFLQTNRVFRDSPELLFIHDRLQRAVTMRQQIVTSLAQSLEQAKIEEVRNTPVLTVVDRPERPLRPDGIGWLPRVVVLLMVALTLGVLAALARGLLEAQRRADLEAYEEASRLLREARGDILRIFRRRSA